MKSVTHLNRKYSHKDLVMTLSFYRGHNITIQFVFCGW